MRRLGLVAPGRALGKAVLRNRVKRWLREVFRHERGALPAGVDVVLVARAGAEKAGLRALRGAFLDAAKELFP